MPTVFTSKDTLVKVATLGAIIWAIVLPYVPSRFLDLFRGTIGSLVLLVLILAGTTLGPVPGVLIFLAVILTFVQRNRGIIQATMSPSTQEHVYEKQLESAPPMSDDEVHPLPELPVKQLMKFFPSDDSGSDAFEPVDTSINDKGAIQTISSQPEQASAYFVQQGFANTSLRG